MTNYLMVRVEQKVVQYNQYYIVTAPSEETARQMIIDNPKDHEYYDMDIMSTEHSIVGDVELREVIDGEDTIKGKQL